MIKYWKIKKTNNLSEFLILNKDSIWISKIDENEISIDEAIEEKKLFGKTLFYKFSDLETIMFDEDNFNIVLNYQTDENGNVEKPIRIEVKNTNYKELKENLLKIFKNSPLKDLTFFDRNKPIFISLLTTIGIGVILTYTIGLSINTLLILLGMTTVEIIVIKMFIKMPNKGKILKLN